MDTTDPYRIGGPGKLPPWPITTGPSIGDNANLPPAADDLVLELLKTSGIIWENIYMCTRITEGQRASAADNTLYIRAPLEDHNKAVSLLEALLECLPGKGYAGKVEIVDPRAISGYKTFPPTLFQEQQEGWEDTLTLVTAALAKAGVDWQTVYAANRGYWEEVSRPAVVVKASCADVQDHPEITRLRAELGERGFLLEILGASGLWGVLGPSRSDVLD
ncbi:uncharacterized protein DSM5745_02030 [Aspergillus mulundensis]|uniref:Uncharacterized protein n=1 Tax=Aspergillus mulundensis TaxID=1810919 RepID=A0A3D8SVE4_9EURO|nr:hypothetical protein DSM5745_02030 [Aspergillus mulundensis]RDW90255.1 hypothetical protein DSM5745_02030 [Aspergillus mulundensis]